MNFDSNFCSTFLSTLAGAFVGGFLAYWASLGIDKNRRENELEEKSKKLLLIMTSNNIVINGIKKLLNDNPDNNVENYDKIFGKYNFDYVIHPIDTYFTDVQADWYTKYGEQIPGEDTNIYRLASDIVKMQSLIVNQQKSPVKDSEVSTKETIIETFNKLYDEQYQPKYNKLFNQKEIKELLKKEIKELLKKEIKELLKK